jgi:uncharacterized protein with PQ loop repeat
MTEAFFKHVGLIAAIVMPFWNIPLMLRIIRRKTSSDISLAWAFGVWACILLMFPSAMLSSDIVLKAYGISNFLFFTLVVVVVVLNRK